MTAALVLRTALIALSWASASRPARAGAEIADLTPAHRDVTDGDIAA
jgi:hypothetical protein